MTAFAGAKLEILANPETLACRVADWLLALAVARQGVFSVALSGGSTPRLLYEQLASERCRDEFPWARTHWFWGDERFVPHDDPLSNYRMVREAMLSRAPVPDANIHAILTKAADPAAAANAYEHQLKLAYGSERLDPARPFFDVVLLGLGRDGHMASLFPGSDMLEERKRWVAAVSGTSCKPRITLTYPALESTRHAAFLVAGEEKRQIFSRLRAGESELPAARFRPAGTLSLFADAAAAEGRLR